MDLTQLNDNDWLDLELACGDWHNMKDFVQAVQELVTELKNETSTAAGDFSPDDFDKVLDKVN